MIEIIDQVIKNRRSIFPAMYTGEKIEDSVIKEVLENANWAPNHKKTEPWRFKVFTGDALTRLGVFLAEKYKEITPMESYKEMKYNKTKGKTLKSSHVIALCIQKDPEGRLPEWEEVAALACAVQNIYLSCTARGIACYWSSPKTILDADEFLKLGEGERCYGLMYIGVPVEGLDLTSKRGNIDEKTEWIYK